MLYKDLSNPQLVTAILRKVNGKINGCSLGLNTMVHNLTVRLRSPMMPCPSCPNGPSQFRRFHDPQIVTIRGCPTHQFRWHTLHVCVWNGKYDNGGLACGATEGHVNSSYSYEPPGNRLYGTTTLLSIQRYDGNLRLAPSCNGPR